MYRYIKPDEKLSFQLHYSGVVGYCGAIRLVSAGWANNVTLDRAVGSFYQSAHERQNALEKSIANNLRAIGNYQKILLTDVETLQAIKDIATEETWKHIIKHFSINPYNVRIGNDLCIASTAVECKTEDRFVPSQEELMVCGSPFGSIKGHSYPNAVEATTIQFPNLNFMNQSYDNFVLVKNPTENITQVCLAKHVSRGSKGHFNCLVYDSIPSACKDGEGLVHGWYNIQDNLYVCMPLPLFGNIIYGGGLSWASFWIQTKDPKALPPIHTGTLMELLDAPL